MTLQLEILFIQMAQFSVLKTGLQDKEVKGYLLVMAVIIAEKEALELHIMVMTMVLIIRQDLMEVMVMLVVAGSILGLRAPQMRKEILGLVVLMVPGHHQQVNHILVTDMILLRLLRGGLVVHILEGLLLILALIPVLILAEEDMILQEIT